MKCRILNIGSNKSLPRTDGRVASVSPEPSASPAPSSSSHSSAQMKTSCLVEVQSLESSFQQLSSLRMSIEAQITGGRQARLIGKQL